MRRRPLLAANWKMNLGTVEEAIALVRRIRPRLSRIRGVDVVVCAPFTVLAPLSEVLRSSRIVLGAQDVHWQERGAHTGEISPAMLAGLCGYVIVGHSERRATASQAEDDAVVNRKVRAALEHGLVPIVCVGESLEQREPGATHEVVGGQVSAALAGLTDEQVRRCVFAYEPVWAIGSGASADPAEANRTIAITVRGAIACRYRDRTAHAVRALYGGSVDPDNIGAFMTMPEIDGALVGGASLDLGFVDLVRNAAAVSKK
jgi:triosephosphate isomerase